MMALKSRCAIDHRDLGCTTPALPMNPPHRFLIIGIFSVLVLVFFFGLGKANLFEPDEGRNAEIAREILLTGDWVTPHNDFLPALDKPMAFFWFIAAAYKAFGISEWSARLPSAFAALGCLLLIYRFSRQLWGVSTALWSSLVWATSVEVFALARIVIFDMALTLCLSLALYAFYQALHSGDDASRRRNCWFMYAAMGLGTLIKGPIAVMVPGMIIAVYLLLTKRFRFIRQMHVLTGAAMLLAIVSPWYLWAEVRNPGYLKYFLWEEHFGRFLTSHFGRGEPWYYFFVVLAAGFLPWNLVLPAVVNDLRSDWRDERKLFLILWVVLPFGLFSLAYSKLPHYILPIFTPLAMLTGEAMHRYTREAGVKARRMLMFPWLVQVLPLLYWGLASLWPEMLPFRNRANALKMVSQFWQLKMVAAAILTLSLVVGLRLYRKPLEPISFPRYATLMALFPLLMVYVMAGVSQFRSAKELAETSRRFAGPASKFVVFDTYLCGLPFYLQVTEPIWIVWSGAKSNIMGSWYVAENQPASPRGKVLFTFNEFDDEWRKTDQPLLIYVKEKNLRRLAAREAPVVRKILDVDGYVLATNR